MYQKKFEIQVADANGNLFTTTIGLSSDAPGVDARLVAAAVARAHTRAGLEVLTAQEYESMAVDVSSILLPAANPWGDSNVIPLAA